MYKLNKEKTKMQSQADVSARPIFKEDLKPADLNTSQLRENNLKDFYTIVEGKHIDTNRNLNNNSNLIPSITNNSVKNSNGGRRAKGKDNYSKNKTFEFPKNYLKSMINNNNLIMCDPDIQLEEESKHTKFNSTMIRNHNRTSGKK